MARPELPPPALLDPGWYPDPTGRYEARFWDGRKWTGNISHYGATGTDPLRRSRWDDRLRPRWLFQLIGLLIVAGGIAAAALYFWPEDNRNRDADRTAVQSAVLTLDDLPPAWAEAEHAIVSPLNTSDDDTSDDDTSDDDTSDDDTSDDGENASDEIADGDACAHFDDDRALLDEPLAISGFAGPDGTDQITNRIIVTEDAAPARDFLNTYRDDRTGACLLERLVDSVVTGDAGLVDTTAELLDAPAFGDEAVWWRLTGVVSGFVPIQINADIIVVRTDRGIGEFTFLGQIERVGVATQRDALQPVAIRLEAALAEPVETDEPADTDG